jgi:hypothetical protein
MAFLVSVCEAFLLILQPLRRVRLTEANNGEIDLKKEQFDCGWNRRIVVSFDTSFDTALLSDSFYTSSFRYRSKFHQNE